VVYCFFSLISLGVTSESLDRPYLRMALKSKGLIAAQPSRLGGCAGACEDDTEKRIASKVRTDFRIVRIPVINSRSFSIGMPQRYRVTLSPEAVATGSPLKLGLRHQNCTRREN
jgi:hypothetical protein